MRLQTDVHGVRSPARIQILSRLPLRPRNLGTIERYLILTNKARIRKHTTARYRSVVCPLIKPVDSFLYRASQLSLQTKFACNSFPA